MPATLFIHVIVLFPGLASTYNLTAFLFFAVGVQDVGKITSIAFGDY